MKIYTVDFEMILKSFIPYHDSVRSIQLDKINFDGEAKKIKEEMESIVQSSRSLVLDQSTQAQNVERFKNLQTKALQMESEFRAMMSQKQNDELEKNFTSIIEIVDKWSNENDIDLVINKNTVVFNRPNFDITSKIIDIIKEKNLYKEFSLEVESV